LAPLPSVAAPAAGFFFSASIAAASVEFPKPGICWYMASDDGSIPIAINSLISGSLKFRQSVFWRHFLQRRYGPRQVGSLQFEHCRGFVIGQGYGALVTKPLHRATKGARHKRAHHLQS
jgi:hypothetical protein